MPGSFRTRSLGLTASGASTLALLLGGQSLIIGAAARAAPAPVTTQRVDGQTPVPAGAAAPSDVAVAPAAAPVTAASGTDAASVESAAPAPADGPTQQVVITGTHIARSGYDSPQPLTAIGQASLDAQAPNNLADFAKTLPAIRGSATPDNSSGALSNGEAGVAALNLRALGTTRTLVLVDGSRWAPSTVEDLVDVNTIPQSLVKEIDVTTGGASAAYGSGAVGGVVNFVLDKTYTGVKASYQYGRDELYGDPTHKVDLTAGGAFAGGRGHALFSGEIYDENGIDIGTVPSWEQNGHYGISNPAYRPGSGLPQNIVGYDIGISSYTPGGLITSGPLKGTYFGPNGTVNQLAYGKVAGQYMQGGDWQYSTSGELGSNSLAPEQKRQSAFARFSYDLTPSTELYTELSYARYQGTGYYISPTTTGITIQADNAYLPNQVRQELAADGIGSFTMGTSNADMPPSGSDNVRATQRYALGLDGNFALFDKNWKWDTHAVTGITNTEEMETPTYNVKRLALATDAVMDPATGQIVCRSTLTDPTNGCIPLDIFGPNTASPAGLAYVLGTPERHETFKLDEGAANFTTNDFRDWAGPISVALGAEGRRESVSGTVLSIYTSGWKYGNYTVTSGSYTVAEGYLETLIPLFDGFDLNGAGRYTSYSTSGGTKSWKIGLTYTPIDDLTFRWTRSADIRAGNLAELYSTGTARTNDVEINGQSTSFVQQLLGNPNVKPEEAKTNVYGIVFQPTFLTGLQASVDYYDIEVSKVISFVSAQQTADFCVVDHIQSYCNNMVYSGNTLEYIYLYYQNLNSMSERGIDLEATYQLDLGEHSHNVGGTLAFHALATHFITNTTNNGVTAINLAGSNSSGGADTPNWIYRLETMYTTKSWTLDFVARGVSSGNLNGAGAIYLQCTASCPSVSSPYFTINDNHAPGAIFFDASLSRRITTGPVQTEVFLGVKNLLNRAPPLVANPYGAGAENTPAYPQTNPDLYDIFGRQWTIGVRMSFK